MRLIWRPPERIIIGLVVSGVLYIRFLRLRKKVNVGTWNIQIELRNCDISRFRWNQCDFGDN